MLYSISFSRLDKKSSCLLPLRFVNQRKSLKTTNVIVINIIAIHFRFSDIFHDVSRRLNFDNRRISEFFFQKNQNPLKPQNIIRAKINSLNDTH